MSETRGYGGNLNLALIRRVAICLSIENVLAIPLKVISGLFTHIRKNDGDLFHYFTHQGDYLWTRMGLDWHVRR